jgi:ribosomal-protein-alanine N-acetyltransferase
MESNTLKLRKIEKSDLLNIHTLHLFPETDRFNTSGIPENIEVTKSLMEDWTMSINRGEKHVFRLESNSIAFVGLVGMNLGKPRYHKAEIWYKIHPSFWGKGFATEAVKELLRLGFEDMNLHRIEAGCATENTASVKFLEKCGFLKEGVHRKNLPIRGAWKDNYSFAILVDEWKKKRM